MISVYHNVIINILKSLSNPRLSCPINSSIIVNAIRNMPDARCIDVNFAELMLRNHLVLPAHYDRLIRIYYDSNLMFSSDFALKLMARLLIDKPMNEFNISNDFPKTTEILLKFSSAGSANPELVKSVVSQILNSKP